MKAKNIFLVDTDQLSLNLLRCHLENQGYNNVHTFTTGFDCSNNLCQRPDVVFLSSNLGYQLNLELLKRIKSFDADIDVILLPGPQQEQLLHQSMRLHSFVKKYDYVLDYIDCVMGRLKAMHKLMQVA